MTRRVDRDSDELTIDDLIPRSAIEYVRDDKGKIKIIDSSAGGLLVSDENDPEEIQVPRDLKCIFANVYFSEERRVFAPRSVIVSMFGGERIDVVLPYGKVFCVLPIPDAFAAQEWTPEIWEAVESRLMEIARFHYAKHYNLESKLPELNRKLGIKTDNFRKRGPRVGG